MNKRTGARDAEIEALEKITAALKALTDEERKRIVLYLARRYAVRP